MKFKRKKPVYKPKSVNTNDIDKGLEDLFVKQKKGKQDLPQQEQSQQVPQQQAPMQQQNPQRRMNIPNPFGGGDTSFDIPNHLGADSTHLKGDMNVTNKHPQPMKFNAPNEWGVKPLNIPQNPSPFGQPQQQQQPMQQRQTKLENFGMQQPQQPQQPEQEDEPYWSAEEWETWAYQMSIDHPDVQQFLPEWFIQALQEEE